uniref:Uncharacterized protein n=1 Tax=Arundo donax TaxID=35708 RepID=A0A0A9DJ31_ARUDO
MTYSHRFLLLQVRFRILRLYLLDCRDRPKKIKQDFPRITLLVPWRMTVVNYGCNKAAKLSVRVATFELTTRHGIDLFTTKGNSIDLLPYVYFSVCLWIEPSQAMIIAW